MTVIFFEPARLYLWSAVGAPLVAPGHSCSPATENAGGHLPVSLLVGGSFRPAGLLSAIRLTCDMDTHVD